jgi:hypothetical protein
MTMTTTTASTEDNVIIDDNNNAIMTMMVTALLPFTSEDQQEENHSLKKMGKKGYNDTAALWLAMEDWNDHMFSTMTMMLDNNNNNNNNNNTASTTSTTTTTTTTNSNCTAAAKLNLTFFDSQSSRTELTRLLNEVILPPFHKNYNDNDDHQPRHTLLTHDVYIEMSTPVAILTGSKNHPLVTTSTMDEFEDPSSSPLTPRSMAGNAHHVARELFATKWNATQIAMLYGLDSFGLAMSPQQLQQYPEQQKQKHAQAC